MPDSSRSHTSPPPLVPTPSSALPAAASASSDEYDVWSGPARPASEAAAVANASCAITRSYSVTPTFSVTSPFSLHPRGQTYKVSCQSQPHADALSLVPETGHFKFLMSYSLPTAPALHGHMCTAQEACDCCKRFCMIKTSFKCSKMMK